VLFDVPRLSGQNDRASLFLLDLVLAR